MSFVNAIVSDLRDKRGLALGVAALLAAIVAVPVVLSDGASRNRPVAQPPATSQPSTPTAVSVVDTGSAPSSGTLTGPPRDPFTQLVNATSGMTISTVGGVTDTIGATGTSSTLAGGESGSTTGSPATGGASTTTTTFPTATTTFPTTTIPTPTPKPAPRGLTATQSYDVKLAITNSSGGLDTIDPLERLSVLPSRQQPLLVEIGVLEGGNRVLFAVQAGTVVGGPGTCIPGPIDCEVLSLGQDQTEALGEQTASGVASVALFAVTGITAADHSSVAAADQARKTASNVGRQLLSASTSSVLPLFQYEPSLGVVVDLRNLKIEGQ